MKKVIILIVCFLCFSSMAMAATAEVTLKWAPVVFPSGSDPAKSGVRLEKSSDKGTTKSLVGNVDSLTSTLTYIEGVDDEWCYYATAFNQIGDALVSDAACVFITTTTPPTVTGLDAVVKVLQEMSTTLKGMLSKMTGS